MRGLRPPCLQELYSLDICATICGVGVTCWQKSGGSPRAASGPLCFAAPRDGGGGLPGSVGLPAAALARPGPGPPRAGLAPRPRRVGLGAWFGGASGCSARCGGRLGGPPPRPPEEDTAAPPLYGCGVPLAGATQPCDFRTAELFAVFSRIVIIWE